MTPNQPSSLIVEAAGDTWQSPRSLSNEWPQTSPDDCARYGKRYGYNECADTRAPRNRVERAIAPAPTVEITGSINAREQPSQRLLNARLPLVAPPLPERRLQRLTFTTRVVKSQDDRDIVSRMLMIGFDGQSISDSGVQDARRKLEQRVASHVVVAAHNIPSREQAKALVAYLRDGRTGDSALFGVEFSGGAIATAADFKIYPTLASAGQSNAPHSAHETYRSMAADLVDLGFNINFSPILGLQSDDSTSGDSFGANALHAASFATAFVHGHMDGGVMTALSHSRISANAAVAAGAATSRFEAATPVYREMVKKRLGDAVTVSGDNAASSIGTLRGELGFRGVIIADFLDADLTTDATSFEKNVVDVVGAGADMLLVKTSTMDSKDGATIAARALRQAIASGRLSPERVAKLAANLDNLGKTTKAIMAAKKEPASTIARTQSELYAIKSN